MIRPGSSLLLIVAVLGLAIWGLLRFLGESDGELAPGESDLVAGESAPGPLPRREGGETTGTGYHGATVALAEGLPSAAATAHETDLVEIELVSAEDGTPLPGAELFVCEPGVMGNLEFRPRLRRAEPKLRARVEPLVADERGICRLPRLPAGSTLFAFTPSRSGRNYYDPSRNQVFQPRGTMDFRVLLARDDQRFRVRTRASDGRLLGDIPIILVLDQAKSGGEFVGRTSTDDGMLELPWPDSDQRHAAWLVAVGGAFMTEVEAPIDFEAPPETIIDLVLPDFGAAEIEFVTPDGVPIDFAMQLGFRVGGRMSFRSLHEKVRDGRCRIGPIEAGATFEYWCAPFDRTAGRFVSSTIAGPVRGGEVLFLRHEIEPWRRRLRLRALDEEGQALAHRHLRVEMLQPGTPLTSKRGLETDADGVLAFGFDEPDPAGAQVTVSLLHKGRLLARGEVAIDEELADEAEIDLGDIVLLPPPLIAAGRVLDREGKPIAHPGGSLGTVDQGKWRELRIDSWISDREGRFELRSHAEAENFVLIIRAPGKEPRRVELKAGTTDLVIGMNGAAHVLGRLVLPEGATSSDYRLVVETREGRTSSIHIKRDGSFTSYWLDAELRAIRLHPRDRERKEHQLIARDIVLETGDLVDLGTIVVRLPAPSEDER